MSFSMPEFFNDHMVLQRDMPVPIWGAARPGAQVTVEFAPRATTGQGGQRKTATVDAQGRWQVVLDPMPACSEPAEITVDVRQSDGDARRRARFSDVLVGDVWFFSGQSNAAMAVRGCTTADETVAHADLPQVRVFARVSNPEAPTAWTVSSPEVAADFPGVPFFFARALHRDEHIPVGMIVCALGGTSVESWTSREGIAANPYLRKEVLEKWERNTTPEALAEIAGDEWQTALAEADGDPVQARSTLLNAPSVDPGHNFERYAIADFPPLALRGFAWYQGESNAWGFYVANRYREQLKALIRDWRGRWGDEEKPFLVVQLPQYPPFDPLPAAPGQINPWCVVMEAQWQVQNKLPNVYTAATIDLGAKGNIHPPNKAPIGERLSLLARKHTLGRDLVCQGPVFRNTRFEDDGAVRLMFDTGGSPLAARNGVLRGFTIAGEDRYFVWANATIEGDAVICRHAGVPNPVAVRYAMTEGSDFTLINEAGLPAGPFRTDDWPVDIPALEARAAVARRPPPGSVWGDRAANDSETEAVSRFRVQHSYRPAEAATEVVFAWDDACLCAYAICRQPMDNIRAAAKGQDDPAIWSDDNIQILIDANHDRQTYYRLAVNPAGAFADGNGFNDPDTADRLVHQGMLPHFRGFNLDWNSHCKIETGQQAEAWTVRLAIPWTSLGFKDAPPPGTTMGLQVTRKHAAAGERSEWGTTGRDYHTGAMPPPAVTGGQQLYHGVSRFGKLTLVGA